jgi:hypothetical protein
VYQIFAVDEEWGPPDEASLAVYQIFAVDVE